MAKQIAELSDTRTDVISMQELQKPEVYQEYSTIVNTTSLGMAPKVDDMVPVCIDALQPHHLVVDLIYNPLETKLLRLAREQGAQTASGLGMFIYQGVLAFEKWNGVRPDTASIEEQLIQRLTR